MPREILAVGWDVGGWRGHKQAVAVCRAGQGKPEWLGGQVRFKITKLQKEGGTLDALVRSAWPEAPTDLLESNRIVLAIDAPLGFPRKFVDLLNGQSPEIPDDCGEIDNRLAHRETDRHVYRTFKKKKPLSASFDRLGNNATVAITYARHWRQESRARIVPLESADTRRPVIIEVYPALTKSPIRRVCYRRLRRLLPPGLQPNSDQYDAAICAVLALAFGVKRRWLPRLVGPPAHFRTVARKEGWIYYLPPRWLRHE